jgi:hypothetical protein
MAKSLLIPHPLVSLSPNCNPISRAITRPLSQSPASQCRHPKYSADRRPYRPSPDGTGLQQRLKGVINHFEVDLAQFVFFHCGTPDKGRVGHSVAEQYRHQALRKSSGSLAMFTAMRLASSLLSSLAADLRDRSAGR